MPRALLVLTSLVVLLLQLTELPANAAPVAVAPPTVAGTATYGETLTAQPGTWEPPATGYAYAWLRDGGPVAGASGATYLLGLDDLDHTLAVQVTATAADGTTASATSAPTAAVARAVLGVLRAPRITGAPRFGRTVRATEPRFAVEPSRVRYQWAARRPPRSTAPPAPPMPWRRPTWAPTCASR